MLHRVYLARVTLFHAAPAYERRSFYHSSRLLFGFEDPLKHHNTYFRKHKKMYRKTTLVCMVALYLSLNTFAFAADPDVTNSAGQNYSSVNFPFALGYAYHAIFSRAQGWTFSPNT